MWSQKVTVCLALFASVSMIVGAERIVIKDYQGPEEKVIVDRVIKYLDVISSGIREYVAVGDARTDKILYTLNPNFAEYNVELNYKLKNSPIDLGVLSKLRVKAEQRGDDKIEIKEIKEVGPFRHSRPRPVPLPLPLNILERN